MSLSATRESLNPIGCCTIPLPAHQKIPSAPTTPQFHSAFKVLVPVHLVLDDHNLRGFGVTPIRSRGVLRDQKDVYPNSSHGLGCSACRPHTWKETALTEVWGANVVMLVY
jgi:hypothetical protein